jgi:hypothetical protein
MPWQLIAIAAVQAGYAIYNSERQQDIAQQTQQEGMKRTNENRNQLLREGLARQRGASSGSLLGGTPLGQSSNKGGTILNTTGDTTTTKSLLGNSL